MKFVEASFEVFNIPEPTDHMGVLKYLEQIGRVCYKSEDKITDESCIKFLNNIRKRKHWAMLEHYIFVMTISEEDHEDLCEILKEINEDNADLAQKIRFIHVSRWDEADDDDDRKYLVSGSATAFNYLWECEMFKYGGVHIVNRICDFLYENFPEIMNVPASLVGGPTPTKTYGPDNGIRFLSRNEITNLPVGLRKIHDFRSVKSITDRGVTHEDVRHRPASWAQESTRYCNYGKLGCKFLIPCWFSEHDQQILMDDEMVNYLIRYPEIDNTMFDDPNVVIWFDEIGRIANTYERLLEGGWNPQQARSILPNVVKTEIIMTAILGEWEHYFNMRVPESAHPQMRELAVPMLGNFADNMPEMFGEQRIRLCCDKEAKA